MQIRYRRYFFLDISILHWLELIQLDNSYIYIHSDKTYNFQYHISCICLLFIIYHLVKYINKNRQHNLTYKSKILHLFLFNFIRSITANIKTGFMKSYNFNNSFFLGLNIIYMFYHRLHNFFFFHRNKIEEDMSLNNFRILYHLNCQAQ